MNAVLMVPSLIGAAGAGAIWFAARRGRPRRSGSSVAVRSYTEIVNEAPPQLRTAVLSFVHPLFAGQMFIDLGLGSANGGMPLVPSVESWDYTTHGLAVELIPLGRQSLTDWGDEKLLDRMAAYIGVERVTASSPEPGWVRLEVRVHDTLAASATLPSAVHNDVDLEAVPVGVREDGYLWQLRVLYAHILLGGATGSGKGSVLWSIIAGLGPAIKAGLVDVWMFDPKGGAEFGRGQDRLWTRFDWDIDGILARLEEAVELLRGRLTTMRETGVRKHIPTADDPLILIIIDEAAALSSYATREQQETFRQLTGVLLSQGRAAAVSIIAALQDPSKETMPNRQLFPVRIGLRLDEPTQTAMVHGQGARLRGALCDKISDQTPGVGYVGEDGTTEFVRVRAFWVSNEDIDAVVEAYAPAPEITGPAEDYSGFNPDDLGDENEVTAA